MRSELVGYLVSGPKKMALPAAKKARIISKVNDIVSAFQSGDPELQRRVSRKYKLRKGDEDLILGYDTKPEWLIKSIRKLWNINTDKETYVFTVVSDFPSGRTMFTGYVDGYERFTTEPFAFQLFRILDVFNLFEEFGLNNGR